MIMDNDILRAWLLIHELADQLSLNQKISNTLHSQAAAIKVSSATGNPRFLSQTISRTKLYMPVRALF
jgi:hypothetical protein